MATTFLHFNKVKVRSIHNFILLCLISLSRILITKYFKAKKKTLEEKDSSIAQEQLRQEELRNAEPSTLKQAAGYKMPSKKET